MIKALLKKWLDERMARQCPPLPQDATIYIMAFVEWADQQAAQHSVQRTALETWQIEALEEGARLMEKRRNEK